MTNLDKLLPEETEELKILYFKWEEAKNKKDFVTADTLREELKLWDRSLMYVAQGLWHPHFEDAPHAEKRAFARMRKYGVRIYPWDLKDAA